MKYNIFHDPFTGFHVATLLGGEFDNCHGYGLTANQAVISLSLTVRAKRNLQKAKNMVDVGADCATMGT